MNYLVLIGEIDLLQQVFLTVVLPVGVVVTRQKGSHLRLTTPEGGEHHVTVPNHDALRARTLNGILKDVAEHSGLTQDAVVEQWFG